MHPRPATRPVNRTPSPSAVLFDLDGTLIDTYRLYLEAYRRALTPALGRAISDEEIVAANPSSERRFLAGWVGDARLEECHASLCRHYAELHGTLGEGLYDGVREMLSALRAAGLRLGVVTGKGRRGWEVTERQLGLGPFGVVVTDDDVADPKPHPGGLLAGAEALGVPPEQVAYVGDSAADLEAGRRAGMAVAAALWAKTGPGEGEVFLAAIQPFSPDWVFQRPADLTRTFAPWC